MAGKRKDDGPDSIELTPDQVVWASKLPTQAYTTTAGFLRLWEQELLRRRMEQKIRTRAA